MKLIRPAGVATLTCYLVPHLFYALVGLLNISLPAALSTGPIRLAKSYGLRIFDRWNDGTANENPG